MFLGYAIAGDMQMALPNNEIAWYWLALAALATGILFGLSITQGIKSWRKDHKQDPMLDSEIRLAGRLFAFLGTGLAWVGIGLLSGNKGHLYPLALIWGAISLGIAPYVWENAMRVLKMVKPEWAKRLSGNDNSGTD